MISVPKVIKKPSTNQTLLIIDGDPMMFLACRKRMKVRGATAFTKIDDDGFKEKAEYSKEEDARYLMKSWENLKRDLQFMLDKLYATDYVMAIGSTSEDNFRRWVYDDYKANRRTPRAMKMKNPFIKPLADLLVMEGFAVRSQGREADDLVRIWAGEAKEAGVNHIICQHDKDLECIPGRHWKLKDKKLITVTEKSAMQLYYGQLLQGDNTDNIPGLPGVGPVTASDMIAICDTVEECQETVVGAYMAIYEDEWKDYLLANGKLIHIQRTWDDYFNLNEWAVVKELEG